ncbi:MAG: S-layer homology domain-containing protein [Clostridia bacterium]|nr:S-layer homology domain-containing protein [Clostridia bacterium]
MTKHSHWLKQTVAICLGIVMVLGMTLGSFAYSVSNDLVGTKYEDAGAVLGALGIMVGDPDGNFRPNDGIKRAEFAKIAIHIMGLEDSAEASGEVSKFHDVSVNHWANGYINVAVAQDIIKGDAEGTFRPEDRISYQEAVTILVRILGYEMAAESKGGYPTGYLQVANQYGFTKNAAGSGSEVAKRGVAAILAYNALTIGVMEQTGFGSDSKFEITDKTILKETLDTEKFQGQITGNHFTKLTSAGSLEKNQIEIDGTVYKNEDASAANYLGYRVTYYLKTLDNGDKVVILVRPETGKNKTLEIDGDNIETVEADRINYWIDKEHDKNTKYAKISASAKMIYNGVAVSYSEEKLKENGTLAGNVKLLDQNDDDQYDVVFVNEYKNLVVDSISSLSYTVTDKFGNPSLQFDPEDTQVSFSLTDKNGKDFDFNNLEEWMVISYLESEDGEVLKATVITDTVSGVVTELEDDKYKINDNFYQIADNYQHNIQLDDEGTFYLDIRGKIAAVNTNSTLSDKYAYLLDAAEADGMNDHIDVKVFTMNGEIKILSSKDKISYNGGSKESAKTILEKLKSDGKVTKQLITYETDSEGRITKINTAEDVSGSGITINKDKFVLNYKGAETLYKKTSSKLGSYVINSNTVVFDIPATATGEDEFAIKDKTMFEDEGLYDVEIYDAGEDLSAKIVLVKNSTGLTNSESPIAVVNKISQFRNEKGEVVEKLYAAHNGQMIALETSEKGILVNEEGKSLKAGDIIQFRTNSQGAIDRISVLFEVDDKGTEFSKTDGDMRLIYGKVDRKFASSINVTVNGGAVENFSLEGVKVISVDTTKSSNKVQLADTGDIQKYDAKSPRLVFIREYKDQVQEIVIVR